MNIPRRNAPLQQFDTAVEEGPFQYILMDLITNLPKSGKHDAILTIVDQGCSKAEKFIPCQKTITGEGVATLYLKHLLPWFGLPKRIISYRDPRFTSQFAKTICKALQECRIARRILIHNAFDQVSSSGRWTNML